MGELVEFAGDVMPGSPGDSSHALLQPDTKPPLIKHLVVNYKTVPNVQDAALATTCGR